MTDSPGIGHNNPPDPLVTRANECVDHANKWLTERGDVDQWTAEIADKANFFLGQTDDAWKELDGQRLSEGRAFKKQQEDKYNAPLALLVKAKTAIADLKRKWLKKEEDRLAAEKAKAEAEAERLAKEAEEQRKKAEAEAGKKGGSPLQAQLRAEEAAEEARAAQERAATAPQKAQIKGAYTSRASTLKDYWSAEITDLSAAFKYYNGKNNPNRGILSDAIKAAIQDIADREAKLLKDEKKAPPGITFKKDRR